MKKSITHIKRSIAVLLLLCSLVPFSFSQTENVPDSLIKRLRAAENDTLREERLYNIADYLFERANYAGAQLYADSALKFCHITGNREDEAITNNLLGLIGWNRGNHPEALKCFYEALSWFEKSGDLEHAAFCYSNIGNMFTDDGNYTQARKYIMSAVAICKKRNDEEGLANCYNGLGNIYRSEQNYELALYYFRSALQTDIKLNNQIDRAIDYLDIGAVHQDKKDYDSAFYYYENAGKLAESIHDLERMINSNLAIGDMILEQKKTGAGPYLQKALQLSLKAGGLENIRDAYKSLSKAEVFSGNYKDGREHYRLFISYRDSIKNDENTRKSVQLQLQYEFGKKRAVAQAERGKKDALAEEDNRRRNIIISCSLIGLIFVVGFSVFLYNRLRLIQRQKAIIEEQKRMVEKQKSIVEEKQREILDSIYYARRIQRAMLTSERYIEKHVKS